METPLCIVSPQFGSCMNVSVSVKCHLHTNTHRCTLSADCCGMWWGQYRCLRNSIFKVMWDSQLLQLLQVSRRMHLQVVVRVAWGGSYMGRPARVCFWVKPHCPPLCCLSKEPRYLQRQNWIKNTDREWESEVKVSCKAVRQVQNQTQTFTQEH